MGKISQWLSQSNPEPISPITNSTKASGDLFEGLARRYLHSQGLKLITSQYQCRLGEVDLIMTEENILAFIEVRYRKSQAYGSPAATVDSRKQQKIIKAARHFLQAHKKYLCFDCRFDVVAINQVNGQPSINWIKNAFSEGFH